MIYIPAITRIDDHLKVSGPSEFRDLLNAIVKPLISKSAAFQKLRSEFSLFEKDIKTEKTDDNRSISQLQDLMNDEIRNWSVEFGINVNAPREDEIGKNLFSHSLTDQIIGEEISGESFGHGFQRHLIYSLIRVAAGYRDRRESPEKKDFSPGFQLILFEEPEAFLHPPQQDVLDRSLRTLAAANNTQVIAATHSPQFVSQNIEDISSLIKLHRDKSRTVVGQIGNKNIGRLFLENQSIRDALGETYDESLEVELEAARHVLWLNSERCSLFFSNLVLIVEGMSEKALIQSIIRDGDIDIDRNGIYILDANGKYNIHRFMNLFDEMKIFHSVLYDSDHAKKQAERIRQERINKLIEESRNQYTLKCERLDNDLEDFLGISVPQEFQRWKASYVLHRYGGGEIDKDRLQNFVDKIGSLIA